MDEPIETDAHLIDWIASKPGRHQELPDGNCSCGWEVNPHLPDPMPFAEHYEMACVAEIPDHLTAAAESGSSGGIRSLSYSEELAWAYECIDGHNEDTEALIATLRSIALGSPTAAADAMTTLRRLYPHAVWINEFDRFN